MKLPHTPIAGLMGAVVAVAVNLAVIRSLIDQNSPESAPHFFFAFGILPMSSLLIVVALISAPNLRRGRSPSPFLFGFEVSGWAAVFAFLTCYSIATSRLMGFLEAIAGLLRPIIVPYAQAAPSWAQMSIELGFATALFSLPQLLIALLGGWLIARSGFTIRFERNAGS